MKRRQLLTYSGAASVASLTGCATPAGKTISTGIPALDSAAKEVVQGTLNKALTDQIYTALGIPNRLAFASGRPMTQGEKADAATAQSLFSAAGTRVPELPSSLTEFNFGAKPSLSGTVEVTNRSLLAWPGSGDVRGRQQVEQAKALLAKYHRRSELSLAEFMEVLMAHRPFYVGLKELEDYRSNRSLCRRLRIPPQTSVAIPLRTGCLGAGLPLPRAGEGTRLIHVGAAVAPELRPFVYGLLNHARDYPESQLDCQYLIWALVHADNASYNRGLLDRVSTGRKKELLERAVPGGYAAYMAMLQTCWARREEEAKKLKTARLALAQLNALAGTSFQLKPPSGLSPGSADYTRDLLKQGFDQGIDDLAKLAQSGAGGLIDEALRRSGLSGQAQEILRNASAQLTPALTTAILTGANSPFDPLQGYTLMRPEVGVHVSDIGGTAGNAQMRVVNTGSTAFDFNPYELGAVTPRRTQAQALWPDFDRLGRSLPPFVPRDEAEMKELIKLFEMFARNKTVNGFDAFYGSLLAQLGKSGIPGSKTVAIVARTVPVVSTAIAIHDIGSYLFSSERPPKDYFNESMTWADFTFSVLGLLPPAAASVGVIKASTPFMSAVRPLAESLNNMHTAKWLMENGSTIKAVSENDYIQGVAYRVLHPAEPQSARVAPELEEGSRSLTANGSGSEALVVSSLAGRVKGLH